MTLVTMLYTGHNVDVVVNRLHDVATSAGEWLSVVDGPDGGLVVTRVSRRTGRVDRSVRRPGDRVPIGPLDEEDPAPT